MDIAEIRKKARTERKESVERPPAEVVRESSAPSPSPVEANVVTASAGREAEVTVPAVILPTPPVASSLPANSSGVEQLFSRIAEVVEVSGEAYGSTLLTESERVEAETRRWLAFVLGSEEYAIDISSIREIIKPREITDIPRVPEFLLGIISLRGNIIPVFDLQRRLRLGVSSLTNDSRIVVCQEGERYAGLLVDRITQVVSIPEESIEPPPSVLSGIDRELVGGVGRFQGKMLILLQFSSVLNFELS